MATKKKAATATSKKRSAKKVMAHDPLAMMEEAPPEEPVQAAPEASPENEKSGHVVDLGGSLVISEVEACRSRLLEALQADGELLLDGAEIEQIDGAGLQLLAAFVMEAERTHVAFAWRAVSPALRDASTQLGLMEILHLNETGKAA